MANIFELTGNILKLQELLENGEIDEQTFKDTMESMEFEIEEKADGYAKIIKNITSDIEGYKTEEKRLANKRTVLQNRVITLKTDLENSMVVLDKKKFKTQLFSFGIQKNAPSLDIKFEGFIPETYFVDQEPKLDKKTLLKDIKGGAKIEGVGIKQSESLRIR